MNYYVLSAVLAYLVLGFILTRSILSGTRMTFRDFVLGSAFMPLLALAMVLFMWFEKLWKRLLIVLDFDPPEEMRAGPAEPSEDDAED